jgi:hypothetical protein
MGGWRSPIPARALALRRARCPGAIKLRCLCLEVRVGHYHPVGLRSSSGGSPPILNREVLGERELQSSESN